MMNARWLGMMAVCTSLLLGAGSARAYDGYSGDTGGPPPPEGAEPSVRWEPASFRDAASAIYAGWPGDTGGPPPLAETGANENTAPSGRVASAPAVGRAADVPVTFTDRG